MICQTADELKDFCLSNNGGYYWWKASHDVWTIIRINMTERAYPGEMMSSDEIFDWNELVPCEVVFIGHSP